MTDTTNIIAGNIIDGPKIIDGKAFAETLRARVADLAASFAGLAGRRAGPRIRLHLFLTGRPAARQRPLSSTLVCPGQIRFRPVNG